MVQLEPLQTHVVHVKLLDFVIVLPPNTSTDQMSS